MWTKTCPNCKKQYKTSSRGQKFCCPECGVKYGKRIKKSRERYDKIKPLERMRVRLHAAAVDIVKLQVEMGLKEWKCDCCGATESLEVHHKSLNFFDNTPSNLSLLCKVHHAKSHSELQKSLDNEGVLIEEYYEESTQPFMKILNKYK